MTELTNKEVEQYEQEAIKLAEKYHVAKVHIYVGIDEDDIRIVGFLKDPSYLQKVMGMDKIAMVGPFTAGEIMREALILTEESDPRVLLEDEYKLGMASLALMIIKATENSFKKK